MLELIGQLYAVERECPRLAGVHDDEGRPAMLELRGRYGPSGRQRSSRRSGPGRIGSGHCPISLGKAIGYMLGLWPGLTRFLTDPQIPPDNNGTEVAALLYSLVESAKLCGVEPKTFLLRAVRAALANPGTVTLPHTLTT